MTQFQIGHKINVGRPRSDITKKAIMSESRMPEFQEEIRKIKCLYDSGLTIGKIAKEIKRDAFTVSRRLDCMGISKEDRKKHGNKSMSSTHIEINKEKFRKEDTEILRLFKEGKSVGEIKKILGFSPSKLSSRLNSLKISKKERMSRGRINIKRTPKNFEENNKKILEFYKVGMTPNEICSKLNLSLHTLRKRFIHLNIPAPKEDKRGYFEGVKKRREFFKEKNKEQNQKILDLYNQGKMIIEIVPIVGISRGTIARRLGALGFSEEEIKIRGSKYMAKTQRAKRKPKFDEENKKILELYNEGFLIKSIAKELDCDINTITRRLDCLKIPKRERIIRGLKVGVPIGVKTRRNIKETNPELYKSWGKKLSQTHIERGVSRLEKNPNWRGGKSFEPYTKEFNNQFRNKIRQRDNQVCMNCLKHREKLKMALHVHHVNYDKLLTMPENCISLCSNCHMLTNYNREYWIKLFQEKLSKLYDYKYDEKGDVILELAEGEGI